MLAEQQGPLEMAQEVRKRLAAVERSSSWLDQKRRDALLADLDRQRQAMVGPIGTPSFDGRDWLVDKDDFGADFEPDFDSDDDEADYQADDNDPDLDPDPHDRGQTVRLAMLAIADALGDEEAYLAEYRDHQPAALKQPLVAARVAQRLTAAGRAAGALALLDAATPSADQTPPGPGPWIDARIAALDQLQRGEEAQQWRWRFGLLRLSSQHQRDYLKR